MEAMVKAKLEGMKFGEIQTHKHVVVIPVSCTEHGRWSYRSSHFEESGHIMSAKLRRIKNASVHENRTRTR